MSSARPTGGTKVATKGRRATDRDAAASDGTASLCEDLVCALMDAGAAAVGLCSVEVLSEARERLFVRRSAGLDGGMQFTFRNPERSTDPLRTLPSARSAVVVAMAYRSSRPPEPDHPVAEVARYAASDTYGALRELLANGAEVLRSRGHRGVVLADDNALVDRSMAVRAGIGWIGKNSNVLVPGAGSWVVLGNILTDVDLPHLRRWASNDPPSGSGPSGTGGSNRATTSDLPAAVEVHLGARPSPEVAIDAGCGPCGRCMTSCPTGAIRAPGVVDPSLCLSWLLQRTGDFPREHRCALGTRIYGCDDCQSSCPPSARSAPGAPVGPEPPSTAGDWVDIVDLLTLCDEALLERFGAWYIPRRDPRYLRRNALVVLGNIAADRGGLARRGGDRLQGADLRELLRGYLGDVDPLLVSHAAWAARRAGAQDLLTQGPWRAHPEVIAELARPLPVADDGVDVAL